MSKTIEYIRPDAPAAVLPPLKGIHYEAVVPDTLDIAERARLAIHGLTSPLDPADGYNLYWLVNYAGDPSCMKKGRPLLNRSVCSANPSRRCR